MPCRFYTLRSVTKLAEECPSGISPTAEDNEAGIDAEEARRQSGASAEASHKVDTLSLIAIASRICSMSPHRRGRHTGFMCDALSIGRVVVQVAALDLARSAYDVLANIQADVEVDAQHSWSGLDAAAAKGGAENSQKRRKRKRLGVNPLQHP